MFIDLIKANLEVNRLNKELADIKIDRDAQVNKLAEFEKTNKDYIESAQTCEAMKEAHKKELDGLKAEYEQKLAAKDAELVTAKQEADKTISTVKESVAAETIALVASQGTNVIVETLVTEDSTPEGAYKKFMSLTGVAKQKFYNEKSQLILKGSPRQ